MTDEIPRERPDTIRCTDCGTKPDVVDAEGNTVTLQCDCDTDMTVTLLRDVPVGWSE